MVAVLEAAAVVVFVALVVATVAMLWIGILAATKVVDLVLCDSCHRTVVAAPGQPASCPYCRLGRTALVVASRIGGRRWVASHLRPHRIV